MKYEYIVAFEQRIKVTFANNEWVVPLKKKGGGFPR